MDINIHRAAEIEISRKSFPANRPDEKGFHTIRISVTDEDGNKHEITCFCESEIQIKV